MGIEIDESQIYISLHALHKLLVFRSWPLCTSLAFRMSTRAAGFARNRVPTKPFLAVDTEGFERLQEFLPYLWVPCLRIPPHLYGLFNMAFRLPSRFEGRAESSSSASQETKPDTFL